MDQKKRIKILRDWAEGKFRPPTSHNGNGVVKPTLPTETVYRPVEGIKCHRCDFRQLPLGERKADAIITDIPWDGKWLEHVEDFAAWCAAKLKPDGIVTTLYSAHNLDRLLAGLTKHLHYIWTCVSPLSKGRPSLSPYLVRHCTLCVVCSNTRKPYFHQRPKDLLPETCGEERRWHEHQQSLSVTQYLVETFAPEGSLVIDPCSGGWTTAVACYRAGASFSAVTTARTAWTWRDEDSRSYYSLNLSQPNNPKTQGERRWKRPKSASTG